MKLRPNKLTAVTTLAVVSTFALSAPAAVAADMPFVMTATAESQALSVSVRIPTLTELRAALGAAGFDTSQLPASDLPIQHDSTLQVAIAQAYGSHNVEEKNRPTHARGHVVPIAGAVEVPGFDTSCEAKSCTAHVSEAQTIEIPLELGSARLAAASSSTPTYMRSVQETGAIDLDLSLANLLGPGKTLALVGDALDQVSATVNANVLGPVNESIAGLHTTVNNTSALQPLKKELDRVITLDQIKDLPKISTSDLVTAKVLVGSASIADEAKGGMTGLRAKAVSEVADLQILGGWVSLDSIRTVAEAYANSVPGKNDADSHTKMDVLNASIGGLLGVHLSGEDLIRLSKSSTLKAVARETLEELGVTQNISDIENAIEIIYRTAGITIEEVPNSKSVGAVGVHASAAANSLRIVVEPTIPNVKTLTDGLALGSIPAMGDGDFIPTGIRIAVELPNAVAESGATISESFCMGSCSPISGLASTWGLGLALLGAALLVRRFALSH